MVSTFLLISKFLGSFTNPWGVVPIAPITMGITVTFTLHFFFLFLQGRDIYLSFHLLLTLLCRNGEINFFFCYLLSLCQVVWPRFDHYYYYYYYYYLLTWFIHVVVVLFCFCILLVFSFCFLFVGGFFVCLFVVFLSGGCLFVWWGWRLLSSILIFFLESFNNSSEFLSAFYVFPFHFHSFSSFFKKFFSHS